MLTPWRTRRILWIGALITTFDRDIRRRLQSHGGGQRNRQSAWRRRTVPVLVLAVLLPATASVAAGRSNAAPLAGAARAGCLTVAIGARTVCLRPGAACQKANQRTYARFGFVCVNRRLRLGGLAVQREGGVVAVGANGQVGLPAAEQAFIAMFGPLPGVKPISGAVDLSGVRSATGVVRWILLHRSQLSPAQRRVVDRVLNAARTARVAKANPELSVLLAADVKEISALLGYRLPFAPSISSAKLPANKDGEVWGLATPLFTPSGRITGCAVKISNSILGDYPDLVNTVAHETTHCFQFAVAGTVSVFDALPSFVVEGYAEWAGNVIEEEVAHVHFDDGKWATAWVDDPFLSLAQRTYDAFAFYDDIDSDGVSPWALLRAMVGARSTPAIYALLHKIVGESFEPNLATNDLLSPSLGPRWTFSGPGLDHPAPELRFESVDNGGSVSLAAPPLAADRARVDLQADIVTISGNAPGALRLSDGRTLDTTSTTLCLLQGGCRCPSGANPVDEGGSKGDAVIAIWGSTRGQAIKLTGESKDAACSHAPPPPPPPQQLVVKLHDYPQLGDPTREFDGHGSCTMQGSTLTVRLSQIPGGGQMTIVLPGYDPGHFPMRWNFNQSGSASYDSISTVPVAQNSPGTTAAGGASYNGHDFFIDANMLSDDGSIGGIAGGLFAC